MDIVVDLGQSGARIKTGSEIINLPIAKKATDSVVSTLEEIFSALPTAQYENAYLSLTGLLGNVGDVNPFGEICQRYFGTKQVFVMDDGLAAYIGALGDSNGVVLTLGGGVVAVSGNHGKFGHADGKGQIFGDFGGGFWVGRYGLTRAISTLDGRDNAQDLVEVMAKELSNHAQLEIKTGTEAAALCISAAKTVIKAAEDGSHSALEILQHGASELGKTVVAAWRKVSDSEQEIPEIAFLGGLSQSQLYTELIANEVQKQINCKVVPARGDHLIGAPLAANLYPNGVEPLFRAWKSS
ncbi:MAG: hypothetical protein RLZZ159_743 [Actinomycetota bacterium]